MNIQRAALVAAIALSCAACDWDSIPGNRDEAAAATPTVPVVAGKYDVTITRTALGIPHLKSNDFGSNGYGYGYVFAEDNLCVLQEDLVTIRGERSKYFGRDGEYLIVPNGVTARNINSDYFWKFSADDRAIAPTKANITPEFALITQGFVDGYNRYIRELKAGQHPGRHIACRDADWLFEISADDMYRRYYRLAIIASGSVFINEIA